MYSYTVSIGRMAAMNIRDRSTSAISILLLGLPISGHFDIGRFECWVMTTLGNADCGSFLYGDIPISGHSDIGSFQYRFFSISGLYKSIPISGHSNVGSYAYRVISIAGRLCQVIAV